MNSLVCPLLLISRSRCISNIRLLAISQQLLVEMDGATSGNKRNTSSSTAISSSTASAEAAAALHAASRVVVVAATNRPDMLDDALLRPGMCLYGSLGTRHI
jgi:SpoVK/Ycf46/Vps4 family AAA+-type ATPase